MTTLKKQYRIKVVYIVFFREMCI